MGQGCWGTSWPCPQDLKWLSVGEAWPAGRARWGEMAGVEGARESCWALGGVRPLEPTVESLCPACGCPTPSSASGTADLRPHSEHLSLSGDQRLSTSGCPGRCRALLLPLPLYSGNAAVGCRRLQAKPGAPGDKGHPKDEQKERDSQGGQREPRVHVFLYLLQRP